MTVIVSDGRLAPVKSFPLSFAGQPQSRGPSAGSIPLLDTDGLTTTYERMVRQQPWVYAVVAKFCWNGARLPFNAYVYGEDGESRKRDRTSEIDRLLRRPRPRASGFAMKSAILWDMHVHGKALVLKFRPGPGQPPSELWNVPWPNVQTIEDTSGVIAYNVVINGRSFPVAVSDTILFEMPGGVSPLEVLRRTLALEEAAITWQGQSFLNGVTPRGSFTTTAKLTSESMPRLRAELEALYAGPENAGRFGLFDQGLQWAQMGATASDAQLIEQRKLSREEVCAAYDMPPPLVGILDRATFSNISELHKALYVDALGPRLTMIEETAQAQLVEDEPAWDGYFVEFNTGALLRPDPEARARANLMEQQSGTSSMNERRKRENLPKINDPLADAIMMPLNMRPVLDGGADADDTVSLTAKAKAARELIAAGFDPADVCAATGLPPMGHTQPADPAATTDDADDAKGGKPDDDGTASRDALLAHAVNGGVPVPSDTDDTLMPVEVDA